MSSADTEGNKVWLIALVVGLVLVAASLAVHAWQPSAHWLRALLEGVGGIAVIFAACEMLIKAVNGVGARMGMNPFVAGTMAGLVSNVPELVMLAFVVIATPRVGFLVTAFTLHVNVAAFGFYSALLPRDASGAARLPKPLVMLSTNLFACAGATFFTTGAIMLMMHVFDAGDHHGDALGATDMYVLGGALLAVEVVAVGQLVKRFSGTNKAPKSIQQQAANEPAKVAQAAPSVLSISLFALGGVVASVIGGHAVGGFADVLVGALDKAGYPKMIGALILSVFASTGGLVMLTSAHAKGMRDVALASASGQIVQVAFLTLPFTMIMLAAFTQLGVIPYTASGGVLPIDLDTVSVLLLGFPSMLILWKAVRDDGSVHWLESVTMMVIFGLVIYFLAMHG
ncbi:MAG: hypothetical protein L0H70_00930 [Xanthomonadales bacterium]|nr:hypothetical protein [Xanthomonadales bacterium]